MSKIECRLSWSNLQPFSR